jgi:hypothetical protein
VVVEDFAVLVGAVASAVGVVAAALAAIRWWRVRRVRQRLAVAVGRLVRQERRLGRLIIDLDRQLTMGGAWEGWSQWPAYLGGQLTYASGLADEAEREEALVRALDADGAVERLRQDVEEMHQVLHKVAMACLDGTIAAYRNSEGEPVASSPAGRELSPVFTGTEEEELLAARRRFTTLMRSTLSRLGSSDWRSELRAEAFESSWPLYRWESADVDHGKLWDGELAPLRWTAP